MASCFSLLSFHSFVYTVDLTFKLIHIIHVCSFNRSVKALLKLPSLIKTLHQLSSTHGITPLLEVFVPQLVSTGVKHMLAEEQSDFYMKPLLEIALELLKEIEFEPGMVITIGRSVLCQ